MMALKWICSFVWKCYQSTHTHTTETTKAYVYFAEITSQISLCSYYAFIYFIINVVLQNTLQEYMLITSIHHHLMPNHKCPPYILSPLSLVLQLVLRAHIQICEHLLRFYQYLLLYSWWNFDWLKMPRSCWFQPQ